MFPVQNGDVVSHDPDDVELDYKGIRQVLPCLEKIHIRGSKLIALVLGNFTAPQLSQLSYSGEVDTHDVLREFIVVSACTLRSFTLYTVTPSEGVVKLLLAQPDIWKSVENLTIQLHRIKSLRDHPWLESGAALIDILTRRPEPPNAVIPSPNLTSFELSGPKSPISTVINMLVSRRVRASADIGCAQVLLKQCRLTFLDSTHRKYTDAEDDARSTQSIRARLSLFDILKGSQRGLTSTRSPRAARVLQ